MDDLFTVNHFRLSSLSSKLKIEAKQNVHFPLLFVDLFLRACQSKCGWAFLSETDQKHLILCIFWIQTPFRQKVVLSYGRKMPHTSKRFACVDKRLKTHAFEGCGYKSIKSLLSYIKTNNVEDMILVNRCTFYVCSIKTKCKKQASNFQ